MSDVMYSIGGQLDAVGGPDALWLVNKAMERSAREEGSPLGRVVMWRWRDGAHNDCYFAIARVDGQGGDKEIWIENSEPPLPELREQFLIEKEVADAL